jgi:hypothetical protein
MIILGTNSIKDTGYDVANSLRFNSGSSDYLNRTPSSSGNRKTWTFSFWIKRTKLGVTQYILSANDASANYSTFRFNGDQIEHYEYYSSAVQYSLKTNRLFRDVSSNYHILLAYDTSQGTAANRIKLYVNGVQETSFATSSYPSQNYDSFFNSTSYVNYLGTEGGSNNADGYMSEVCFIDGTALDPTSFGEFDEDSGIWKPIDVSGLTFGTNGFYLDFEDSSALGNDAAGSNNFTVNNLTAIDQSTDTCTNNFCTLNALNPESQSNSQLSEGNLKLTNVGGNYFSRTGNIAVTSGKWYAEVKITQLGSQSQVGIIDITKATGDSWYANAIERAYVYLENGYRYSNDSGGSWGADSYTTGDIIGIAMDLDNNKVYVSKNGTWQNSGDPTSGATGTGAMYSITDGYDYSFVSTTLDSGTDPVHEWNFGSPPYSESGGETDGNSYGNFAHEVPSGYYSLCTKNLAEYG